jgi:hypothetical protein
MKTTVNNSQFHDAFHRAGRGNQFSHEGLNILFGYLEQLEEDIGQEIELDVIGLCCEYSESAPDQIAKDYNIGLRGNESPAELAKEVLETLYDHTQVAGVCPNGNIVFAQF